MKREQFVRTATAALRMSAGKSPEEQAEAIATLMDTINSVMGSDAATEPASQQGYAFPAAPPDAVVPMPLHMPPEEERLIIPATRIPDRVERAERRPAADVVASPTGGRLKVEELSQLVQDRAPVKLVFDVQMEDGTTRSVSFVRNVLSRHALDSVQLVYYPPNALPSAREATEVQAVIHVDDVPFDLAAILETLRRQAAEVIRPRRMPQSVAPPLTSGPVKHAGDTYQDPALQNQTQSVFNSLG